MNMSDTRSRGPLDRLLGIFGDVRAGEGGTVLLISGLHFFRVGRHFQPHDDCPVLVLRERDLCSRRRRSLVPVDSGGSAAGAPLGAALAERLFALGLSPYVMMEMAAGILLLHLGLYRVLSRRAAAGRAAEEPMKPGNGFALVLKSRYLSLIALFLVLLKIVNTVGEYILGQAVVTRANAQVAANPGFTEEVFIGTFYGKYFFWTNVATILIQAFLVSRIVKRFGMRGVLLALPVVALGAYGLAAVGAGLTALLYVKIAENSTDYSVMNTGKQMFWLPTSREEKYKAKQAIDNFFVRSGDMLAAGVVFLGTHRLTSVTHTVAIRKIHDWLNGGARTPKEAVMKERLRPLL